ncbi:MAG TPA: APC family permease [Anaerolineaceae bacterium]|nr:APC family permease [Anaerolineaceae bacterium]
MVDPEASQNIFEEPTTHTPTTTLQTWLIGRPLATADAPHQTIGKLIGLAVFASDALSSTAYATQEIMIILAAAGSMAFHYVFPISIAIVILMAIVTFSYEQTIHAYPGGGGAYIVARDNLGEIPALVAGAALLMDYILTVAVSISSGVAQIVSAFPNLMDYRVMIAVGLILFVMLINLRGVKESGVLFAIPTYFFVISMFITVIIGLVRYFSGSLGVVINPPEMTTEGMIAAVSPFLLLHAFSSGTAALTGIEAISNGITAFKEPRSRNAGQTLIFMAFILGSLFLGISFLASRTGVIPSEIETVISQLTRTVLGGQGIPYLLVIASTALILILAANTAFADFPRLSALQAADGFLPRQLTFRGSRLVYSGGIVLLAVIASLLVVGFKASVTSLIPLYAIGVFLSFTLSQTGMARRWWKSGHIKSGEDIIERGSTLRYDAGWRHKMIINGFGALCTVIVMFIFAITKFRDGAWIIIFLIPLLVFVLTQIRRHYRRVAASLSLENNSARRNFNRNRVIMPISGVHNGTLAGLHFARSLSSDITVVHVSIDPVEAERVKAKWETWGDGYRLLVLESPYRLLIEPLLEYIDKITAILAPNEIITLVVPQFLPKHWWTNFLHMRTADTLRKALLNRKNIIITEVPYHID